MTVSDDPSARVGDMHPGDVIVTLTKVESHLWRIFIPNGSLTGWVSVSRNPKGQLEIGWGTREEYREQGMCTAAASEVLAWLEVECPDESVVATIRPTNAAPS